MSKFIELSNGVKMPTFGLGTWQVRISLNFLHFFILSLRIFQATTGAVAEALRVALTLGYRHIDTGKSQPGLI